MGAAVQTNCAVDAGPARCVKQRGAARQGAASKVSLLRSSAAAWRMQPEMQMEAANLVGRCSPASMSYLPNHLAAAWNIPAQSTVCMGRRREVVMGRATVANSYFDEPAQLP